MTRAKPAPVAGLLSARRGSHYEAGFSLVEIMISTVILAMVSAGSLGMFTVTTRQATISRLLQEEEFAIRMDLASIQNMNDRFTCYS
jgi:prepilin-type N-terminal cleavage/methylation domain-containing protein